MTTLIISAFPGTGKSYAAEKLGAIAMDSDSSSFSWIENGVRHPDFPANYIAHIRDNIGKVPIIFVSSHAEVRRALTEAGIPYTLVYPDPDLKDEYIARFRQRGSPEPFISLVNANWYTWLSELPFQRGCEHVMLKSGEHVSDLDCLKSLREEK